MRHVSASFVTIGSTIHSRMHMNTIVGLYRYPVKGLSAEGLESVELTAGNGFPLDRQMAITDGAWLFDADSYEPRPKTDFLMLARDEALAALTTRVNVDGTELTIISPEDERIVAHIDDADSLDALSRFLQDYLGGRAQGEPRLVRSERHRFTDVSVVSPAMMSAVSLVNLASVRDLERLIGAAVEPLRFRANIYFDSGNAWEELDWVGREFDLGTVRMRIVKRIARCPATNVEPGTGRRNRDIPAALRQHFDHRDMGIYAEIVGNGKLSVGDAMAACTENTA